MSLTWPLLSVPNVTQRTSVWRPRPPSSRLLLRLTVLLSVVVLVVVLIVSTTPRVLRLGAGDPHCPSDWPPAWLSSPLWPENGHASINPHPFEYLINQPNLCSHSPRVDLLILISSAVGHVDRRDAIRATWGSTAYLSSLNVKLLFLLGQGRDRQTAILLEARLHQDIIQEDFHDAYYNLTLKTVMGIKWSAIFCPQARFVLKTDDDIFVNVPLLHQNLFLNPHMSSGNFIVGCVKNGLTAPQPIAMSTKPNMIRMGHPEFTAGAGYLMPGSRIQELYVASLSTRLISVEDAFTTGYCAAKIGLHPPHHDARFSCGQLVPDDCQMAHFFTGHRISPDRQFSIFDKLHSHSCSPMAARSSL